MFDAHLSFRARQQPRATAVVTPQGDISYEAFDADVSRFAQGLLDLGVTPGQVVSIRLSGAYLPNLALMALGRIGVASSPAHDPGADLRLTDAAPAPDAKVRQLHLTREWLAKTLSGPPPRLPRPNVDPLAIGRVMLSSGTTGAPRRVGLTWRRIELGNYVALSVYGHGRRGVWIPLTGPDSMMGHSQILAAWTVGAAVLTGAAPQDLPAYMERLEPGVVAATPKHLREALAVLPPDYAPRPGWLATTGGSVLPLPLAREVRQKLASDLRILYGATEVGLSLTGDAAGLETAPDLLGWPAPGAELQVVGDDGNPVPDGEQGELLIRGERMAAGYLDDPEGTAERFGDGWFRTRDLVRRLPDGRFVMDGRIDDRMNLGGVKFMPQRLETPALDCPGVRDAAAFAVPDDRGVDQVWLAVSAAPGFDRDSLVAHLAKTPGLPPLRFAWIDEIPRNAMGKVERGKLRDALLAATQRGA